MYSIHNLSFEYRASVPVLHHITATINKGECLGIVGPNGSGKSTLLKLLVKILPSKPSEISFDRIPLTDISHQSYAKRVAYLGQNQSAPFPTSVFHYILMGRFPFQTTFSHYSVTDKERVWQLAEKLNIAHLLNQSIHALSGGEFQKVQMAMVLVRDPDVVFLDEPTHNLDIGRQQELIMILEELKAYRDKTIVFVSHDVNLVSLLSDTVLVLKKGIAIAHGRTSDVLTRETIGRLYDIDVAIDTYPRSYRPRITPLFKMTQ